jgi:hypothetical protein
MCSFMSNEKLDALIEELKAKAQGGAVWRVYMTAIFSHSFWLA